MQKTRVGLSPIVVDNNWKTYKSARECFSVVRKESAPSWNLHYLVLGKPPEPDSSRRNAATLRTDQ
jgi:hypothetical protein